MIGGIEFAPEIERNFSRELFLAPTVTPVTFAQLRDNRLAFTEICAPAKLPISLRGLRDGARQLSFQLRKPLLVLDKGPCGLSKSPEVVTHRFYIDY
jgi:hypothetical protein